MQFVLRFVFTVWLRYRARGVEKVPQNGGALFLVNHQSFLDPLLVGLPLSRPVSYLARDSLFRVPVIGWILRHTYVIPINREAAGPESIKGAVERMRHGFLVGIFPEGTRSEDGQVGPLKPGFVSLVRRGKVPVYPVGVAGAHEALPRRAWLLRPRKVRVVFGDPLPPEDLERLTRKGREDELLAYTRERICECQRAAEAWRRR
jgi:1-acyl-sn-glycerol-3-phosphate acyltransferase